MTVKKEYERRKENLPRGVYVCAQGRRKGFKTEVEERIARETRVQKGVDGERSAVVKE